MKNSTLSGLIIAGIIGIFALMMINLAPSIPINANPELTPQGNVRGFALYHRGTPFTLNFDQQKLAMDYLNRAVKVKKSDYTPDKSALAFDKLVIYRFDGGDLELVPVTIKDRNIAFSTPTLAQDQLLLETSGGELNILLNQTYDP
jgi:hypothetical protein